MPVSDRGIVVREKAGSTIRMIGGVADISAQRQAEEQLIHNASHDALTGVANRELFLARVRQALASGQQQPGRLLAVLFLDLDRFKVVSDGASPARNAAAAAVSFCGRGGGIINLSEKQFAGPVIADQVNRALLESGLEGDAKQRGDFI